MSATMRTLRVCGCVAHAQGPHLHNNWTGACNPQKFSLRKSRFVPKCESFFPRKFSAIRYAPGTVQTQYIEQFQFHSHFALLEDSRELVEAVADVLVSGRSEQVLKLTVVVVVSSLLGLGEAHVHRVTQPVCVCACVRVCVCMCVGVCVCMCVCVHEIQGQL